MGKVYKIVVIVAIGMPMLTGCGPSSEEKALKAAADSMAAARARGETDLSNPEMGAKLLVELTDGAMKLSHTELPKGQVTVAIMNKGPEPRVFQLKGEKSNIQSMPIQPGGHVLVSALLDAGAYDLLCPDSTGENTRCGTAKLTLK